MHPCEDATPRPEDSFANPIWLFLPSAIGLVQEVFTGCYQPLLPTGSSE
jgi:hypothetical protein